MNVDMLEQSGKVACKLLTGSRAYGTARPDSDYDYRGVFILPAADRLTLKQLPTEVSAEKPHDIKYYELAKFLALARDCNPNIIELLWLPFDCLAQTTPAWACVIASRRMFVSQKAMHTFSGYAYAQIKKMRGQNKFVNNPQPKEHPRREDFCWFISEDAMRSKAAPCRPVRYAGYKHNLLNGAKALPLEECHVAGLEHARDTYRLYYYGTGAKGVFRNGSLVCESIPKEEEAYFIGLLMYNKDEYEKAVSQWRSYWTWIENRNPVRWKDQESGRTTYDAKNAMHCVRLLMSAESILRTHEPAVRHTGPDLRHLLDILGGGVPYETLMTEVETRMARLEDLKKTTTLPYGPDDKGIERLFKELVVI